MEQYCLTPTKDLNLLTFIDSDTHFPKHSANCRNEMQPKLEDKDAAFQERGGKGKLKSEFLKSQHSDTVAGYSYNTQRFSLLTCTTNLCKFQSLSFPK